MIIYILLWEEIKYMNLNKNAMMPKNKEKENGTEETPKKLKKHVWKIIGNQKMWSRSCPCCKEDIWHISRDAVYRKSNTNRPCRTCWSKNKKIILERKCPNCLINLHYKDYKNFWTAKKENLRCRSCSKIGNHGRLGQKNTDEHNRKVGNKHRGKKITDVAKQRMREAALSRIRNKNIRPYTNYNPAACNYFDELNKQNEWNLQHALNGGEIQIIGYLLDAYDKEKNIVVEYDEPMHEKPSIKQKDVIRQQRILEHLNCKFYRYSEKYKTLTLINNTNSQT